MAVHADDAERRRRAGDHDRDGQLHAAVRALRARVWTRDPGIQGLRDCRTIPGARRRGVRSLARGHFRHQSSAGIPRGAPASSANRRYRRGLVATRVAGSPVPSPLKPRTERQLSAYPPPTRSTARRSPRPRAPARRGRPLQPRVEVVLAGEEVRRRQPHERQPRTVGAAADRLLDRLRPVRLIASRARSIDLRVRRSSTSRMLRYDCSTTSSTAAPRFARDRLTGQPLDQRRLLGQPAVTKSRSSTRRSCDRRPPPSDTDGRNPRSRPSSPATAVLRQRCDEVGRDLDGVDHLTFGVTRVRVEALEGDGDRVGREAFVSRARRGPPPSRV